MDTINSSRCLVRACFRPARKSMSIRCDKSRRSILERNSTGDATGEDQSISSGEDVKFLSRILFPQMCWWNRVAVGSGILALNLPEHTLSLPPRYRKRSTFRSVQRKGPIERIYHPSKVADQCAKLLSCAVGKPVPEGMVPDSPAVAVDSDLLFFGRFVLSWMRK